MTHDFDTTVRVALFQQFVHSGVCPTSEQLAQVLGSPVAEVRAAFERLAAGKVIVLQPESREVLMANPLSAVPTPYSIRSHGHRFFGSCVWDAMGIAAMLTTPAVIETSCACCGEAMRLDIAGDVNATPPAIIHFAVPAKRWWENIVFT